MALYVGDVVAFINKPSQEEGLCRTTSTYGSTDIELIEMCPCDNEPYIVTGITGHCTYTVRSVRDKLRYIGWELMYKDGKYWWRTTQYLFDWYEMEMVPVWEKVDVGRVIWMGVDGFQDVDSTYAEVREFSDDDTEVSSVKIL